MAVSNSVPLRIRFWKRIHHVVNELAWDLTPESERHLLGDRRRWFWRLNKWAADHWVPWWMDNYTGPIRLTDRGRDALEKENH